MATAYLNQELRKKDLKCEYLEKAVLNKIHSMVRKGKQMYSTYQKKGKTGKEYDGDPIAWESAVVIWPNFETFYKHFKDHPSLGQGRVDESCVAPIPKEEVIITDDLPEGAGKLAKSSLQDTPLTSRCPSRLSNKVSRMMSHTLEMMMMMQKKNMMITPLLQRRSCRRKASRLLEL